MKPYLLMLGVALALHGSALAQTQPPSGTPAPQTGVSVGIQVNGGSQGTSVSGTVSGGRNVGPVNVNGQAGITHNMPNNGAPSTNYNFGGNVAPKPKR